MPIGWKLTADQKADAVARVNAGRSHREVAAHFGVAKSAITGLVNRRAIGLVRVQLTEAQESEMVHRYAAKQSAQRIAVAFNVHGATVRRVLRRHGVTIRGQREAQAVHPLRHDAFDVLTPDAAYWIGFLFADGSVVRNYRRSPVVSVGLSELDHTHLVKLRTFLGSGHAITFIAPRTTGRYTCHPTYIFRVTSSRIADQLLRLGRYEGPVDDELVISRDFWRGVVDGDGTLSVSQTGRVRIGLVGERRLLEAFNVFLQANDLPARSIYPDRRVWQLTASGSAATRIINHLYRDAPVALDRKAHKADMIINSASTRP